MRLPFFPCLFAALVGALTVLPAQAQINRRDRQDPELIIEPGGRMGYCDFLTFTNNGKQLLAVGDDKAVRIWDFVDGQLKPGTPPVLRWSVWREQRGAIYALALSPDAENKHVAIGGLGALTSTVTILDRATGAVIHTVTPLMKGKNFNAVWSVAYAPSGKKVAFGTGDGSVFVWDFKTYKWCGQHPPRAGEEINTVRLVRFLDEDKLLSVAEDGSVSKWDVSGDKIQRTELPSLRGKDSIETFRMVVVSPDRKWLVGARKSAVITIHSLVGEEKRTIPLGKGEYPRAVAFHPKDSNRLMVSIGSMVPKSDFFIEADDVLRSYDLSTREPIPTKGPPHTYRAEALAFHPTENYLAVAGGENHEVTLWNLDKTEKPASVMRGVGNCLWGVALSQDGTQIAFQDHRDAAANNPNKRGTNDWRVFNLTKRQFQTGIKFISVPQFDTADGWTIEPDPNDPFRWIAVGPGNKRFGLEHFKNQENMPRCYTFIKADSKTPTRVAVGHYWGLSLYELTADGAKRTRVFAGHQGEVMGLAVSADHSWLVSVGNDQTVAAWNIGNDFTSHPILGAKFALERFANERDRLLVKKVDVGSPAWEAGLLENDEVVGFRFAAKPQEGDNADWLKRLENPVPGKELYFEVRRGGHPLTAGDRSRFGLLGGCNADWIEGLTVKMVTTARHRPLWRFFPTRDNEWALWMWRSSFYDTSTKGDSYIGWHVNGVDLDQAPTYYRAEQFRKLLERKDVIDKLLQTRNVKTALKEAIDEDNPEPLSFDRFAPSLAALQLGADSVIGQDVDVTVWATAIGTNIDNQPERAELWINDYRFREWKNVAVWAKTGNKYTLNLVIPNENLRTGPNIITFQAYNHLGIRGEETATIVCKRKGLKPRLLGMAVGINDYSAIKGAGGERGNLRNLNGANNDAKEFEEKWRLQDQLYDGKPEVFLHLDEKAKRADLIKALEDLANKVRPDDNCVILLAGHGLFVKQKGDKNDTFVFCCPDFDLAHPADTGLSSEVLYEKLAAIKGHKVVILDACHSGVAAANPVRNLTPGDQGPVIMAACDRDQSSYEFPEDRKDKLRHGLFTYAIIQALGDKFTEADVNPKTGELDAKKLYTYTQKRLPALLKEIDQTESAQRPILFMPKEKLVPLARLNKN